MIKALRAGLRNRATTWLGIGAVMVALGGYITAWADGDPTTKPDLDPVIEMLSESDNRNEERHNLILTILKRNGPGAKS